MIEVLDASVVIKWFVDEPGREQAVEILRRVLSRPRGFAVPSLIWYEMSHVLCRVRPNDPVIDTRLGKILNIGIPSFAPTASLCSRAMKFVNQFSLSGYDAHYVALAEELKGHWVTFDGEAARKVRPEKWVRCLSV